MAIEEQECKNYFVMTLESGWFVRLLFGENKTKFGKWKVAVMNRLKYLERKFQSNREFYNQCSVFMQKYIQLNISRIFDETSMILPIEAHIFCIMLLQISLILQWNYI